MSTGSNLSADSSDTDEFGRVEVHGIDYIPPSERHGKPRELFWVWTSVNVNYLYILLGGLLMVYGLTIWQALAVVVVGNLFWIPIGVMAVSGPESGTPSSVIMRSMFGARGNRINAGLFQWPVFIAYAAINLSVGALAGFAFLARLDISVSQPAEILLVLVMAAVTLTISIYGHATIMRMSTVFTALLSVAMVILGGLVLAHTDWGYSADPAYAPSGGLLWGTMMAGVTLIAASSLSWGVSPDYARYLPQDSSKMAVATWTALGGFIPAVLLGAVGVLAGTAIDMSDPQTNLATILPGWFYLIFLLTVILGSMTSNVLTMYSSGLYLQAVGIRLRRWVTVLIDGLLGVALACYAMFIADFSDTLGNIMQMSVAILAPVVAIYVADLLLRRNRYNGLELHDETPSSSFWFTGGYNMAGLVATIIGTVAAALCLNTTMYVGPVAEQFGGADLSVVVGPIVAVVLYVGMVKVLYPRHFATSAPAA